MGNLTQINVADVTGDLRFVRDVLFEAGSRLTVPSAGTVRVERNLLLAMTNEADFGVETAGVILSSPGAGQLLEVAGEDLGVNGANSGNFGIGQLVIGEPGLQTSVSLADIFDNGNRGATGKESLYLYGLGGPEGLRIFGGSVLVLNSLNVYAFDPLAGQQVHLNGLFGPGDFRIPYDDGFLQLAAGDFFWVDPSGGDFQTPANWQLNLTPLAGDRVTFDLNTPGYAVQFADSTAVESLTVRQDNVTFQLGGFTLRTLGGAAPFSLVVGQSNADTARLTIQDGTVTASNVTIAHALGSTGNLVLRDQARLDVSGTMALGQGTATLRVESGAQVGIGSQLDLGRQGSIVLDQGSMTVGSAALSPTVDTLRVRFDGLLTGNGSVDGNLETDGTVRLEIRDAMQSDQVFVTRTAVLAGVLDLEVVDPYVPAFGEMFLLLSADGGITGTFASVDGAILDANRALAVVYDTHTVTAVTALAGDANLDGVVDGSDFNIWNSNKFTGGGTWSAGDFNGDGLVDGTDFGIWNAHKFTSVDSMFVPEPGLWWALAVVAAYVVRRWR